jgi:dihydrofolate synthase/folylpolyglutamate synthase
MPKPHVIDYTERIQVDGQPISRDRFAALLTELEPLYARLTEELGAPTEFELLTTAALYFYAHEAVDLLVCEVGLGGRLDATNVVDLGVEIITNVGFDHMQYLGTTLTEIAKEKAAILKPGSRAATGAEGEALAVIERAAAEHSVPLLRLGREVQVSASSRGWHGLEIIVRTPAAIYANLAVPLIGRHQAANAALAVAGVELLRARGWDLEPRHIRTGLARTRWPGRLDLLPGKPDLLVDAAHNQPALAAIVPAVRELLAAPDGRRRPLAVVFGAMADKDLDAIFAELAPLPMEALIFTPIQYARAATPEALLQRWQARRPDSATTVIAAPSLVEALARARIAAGPAGLVLACGSIYLVGEILASRAPALSAH